jgi:hypothetical protein
MKPTILILLFSLVTLSGCSYQYRTANVSVTADDMKKRLHEIRGLVNSGGSDSAEQEFYSLFENENSTVFFADSNGDFGPVASVLSVFDYSRLGSQFIGLGYDNVTNVAVAFVDLPNEQGDECALMIYLEPMDNSNSGIAKFYKCFGAGVDGGEFLADLYADDSTHVGLSSLDVDSEGLLKGVIQMRVLTYENGVDFDNGKFSTLVGYGP